MKIVIVNGNSRHGSTWNCIELFKSELMRHTKTEVQFKEFSVPRDMPHFCNGCFSCFLNGEHTCPHYSSMQPIVEALEESDLIILSSPVYGMDVTGQMKSLLDHLCYQWMSHRPNPSMFQKLALTVSTTAGIGLGHTTKTLKNSLRFWGVKRIFSFKSKVSAMKWEEIKEKDQNKIKDKISKLAEKIAKSNENINQVPMSLYGRFLFIMMSKMHKGNNWNLRDRAHWEKHGWLEGGRPYRKKAETIS